MNAKQWNASTNAEKAKYLVSNEITIKSKTGMRADAVVNDPNPCVTVWVGYVGIVQVTDCCESSIEALKESVKSLDNWNKELEE